MKITHCKVILSALEILIGESSAERKLGFDREGFPGAREEDNLLEARCAVRRVLNSLEEK